jgi:hypothetical protein
LLKSQSIRVAPAVQSAPYYRLSPPAPSTCPAIGCDDGNGDGRGAIGVTAGMDDTTGTTAAGLRAGAVFFAGFLAAVFLVFAALARALRATGFLRRDAADFPAFFTMRFFALFVLRTTAFFFARFAFFAFFALAIAPSDP